jgi:hypothetical protein
MSGLWNGSSTTGNGSGGWSCLRLCVRDIGNTKESLRFFMSGIESIELRVVEPRPMRSSCCSSSTSGTGYTFVSGTCLTSPLAKAVIEDLRLSDGGSVLGVVSAWLNDERTA